MINKKYIAALILCGGKSTRMKNVKALAKVNKKEFLAHLIEAYLLTPFSPIILITGFHHKKIEEYLSEIAFSKNTRIVVVYNENHEKGQFSSVEKGVKFILNNSPDCSAFAIHPIDAPLVRPSTLNLLHEEFQKNRGKIILPYFENPEKTGHPAIFPISLKSQFLIGDQGKGARSIMAHNREIVLPVKTYDKTIITNFNSEKDIEDFEKNFQTDLIFYKKIRNTSSYNP